MSVFAFAFLSVKDLLAALPMLLLPLCCSSLFLSRRLLLLLGGLRVLSLGEQSNPMHLFFSSLSEIYFKMHNHVGMLQTMGKKELERIKSISEVIL